jgi:hypothetical protein
MIFYSLPDHRRLYTTNTLGVNEMVLNVPIGETIAAESRSVYTPLGGREELLWEQRVAGSNPVIPRLYT